MPIQKATCVKVEHAVPIWGTRMTVSYGTWHVLLRGASYQTTARQTRVCHSQVHAAPRQ